MYTNGLTQAHAVLLSGQLRICVCVSACVYGYYLVESCPFEHWGDPYVGGLCVFGHLALSPGNGFVAAFRLQGVFVCA